MEPNSIRLMLATGLFKGTMEHLHILGTVIASAIRLNYKLVLM